MPRQARLDAPGTLHHVMIRGIEKRNIVDDDWDRTAFVSRLGDQAKKTGTAIYAWSLLKNHAHLLLRSGYSGLPRFMRRLLTGYAVGYNRRHKRFGHLFQNRYKSILCEEGINLEELVSGSRRPSVSVLRSTAATQLVEHHGVALAEAVRVWGVTTSAISKMLQKARDSRNSTNSRTSPK